MALVSSSDQKNDVGSNKTPDPLAELKKQNQVDMDRETAIVRDFKQTIDKSFDAYRSAFEFHNGSKSNEIKVNRCLWPACSDDDLLRVHVLNSKATWIQLKGCLCFHHSKFISSRESELQWTKKLDQFIELAEALKANNQVVGITGKDQLIESLLLTRLPRLKACFVDPMNED
jgi:hypothetical protein